MTAESVGVDGEECIREPPRWTSGNWAIGETGEGNGGAT